jgi:NADP-dependent 3-hydroxy acid dehydrogenase YdfG
MTTDFITGVSSGIGAVYARRLDVRGHQPYLICVGFDSRSIRLARAQKENGTQ